ncbi:unnamed protein product, partial [Mesorhabditis spiculigera]
MKLNIRVDLKNYNGSATERERVERERLIGEKAKLGHRRIGEQGEISYKKVPTDALMKAIQLGIANSIGKLASYPKRDLLVQDFDVIETVSFPSTGSTITPTHNYGDFRFKTYAPIAFRYFRKIFHIHTEDFLSSLCTRPLKELSNAGASGSIFYVSHDDQFIIKTVQHKEAEFLQKLLPGYYLNINQNPRTLLPKFFGLFCYQTLGKNIRLVVMNNLLPQAITIHEKYDLKGSTYKRIASQAERAKSSPTLKDLDFNNSHPNGGINLEPSAYEALMQTMQKDCLVLESFKIMDYSLLVGIHNVDESAAQRRESIDQGEGPEVDRQDTTEDEMDPTQPSTSRSQRAIHTKYSVWEGIKGSADAAAFGGVPARNSNGDRIILFLGIIDILQAYQFLKKFEHTWKSILHDGDTISVHNPKFYASRFLSYMQATVFKKMRSRRRSKACRFQKISATDQTDSAAAVN